MIPMFNARKRASWASFMACMLCPFRVMLPELGLSSPASRVSRVDLPLPDCPSMARLSPSSICRLSPFRTSMGSGLAAVEKDLLRSFTSRIMISGDVLQKGWDKRPRIIYASVCDNLIREKGAEVAETHRQYRRQSCCLPHWDECRR